MYKFKYKYTDMVNTRCILPGSISINKKKIERNNEMQMKSNCAKDFNFYLKQNIYAQVCDLSYRARPQLALKNCRLHYCFNDWMVSMLLPPLPYCFFSQRNVHMLSFQVLMATLLIYMDWYHHNVLANFLRQHNLTILYEI